MFWHWKSKVAIFQEGPEPLPQCDQYAMHMQATRLFEHKKSDKCHKSTERRLRKRYVEMAESCGEMESGLDGGGRDERVENVTIFRYLRIPLDQTDDDCPAVRQNIMRARSVWGRLGTLLRQKGTEPRVSAIFYRAVVQAIALYGSDMWFLLAKMGRKVEGIHTGLLCQITGDRG